MRTLTAMRVRPRTSVVLLSVAAAVACEYPSGPQGPPEDRLTVEGDVYVGPFAVYSNEVSITAFLPADTLTPVLSSFACDVGRYCVDLGSRPDPRSCDFLARAQRWDGVRSPLTPLFANRALCRVQSGPVEAPRFDLPYEPLSAPLSISGIIYVDGERATMGEASARIDARPPLDSIVVTTDSVGRYTFTTTQGALWYDLCLSVRVRARVDGREQPTYLRTIPHARCANRRDVPDVRVGSRKAAEGTVHLGSAPVAVREAHVELIRIIDESVVGDSVWTLDDGTYHIWFPDSLQSPGCGWRIRATVGATTQTQLRNCSGDIRHDFTFQP